MWDVMLNLSHAFFNIAIILKTALVLFGVWLAAAIINNKLPRKKEK